MLEKLKGKKTYIVAIVGGLLALVQPVSAMIGHPVEVPEYVYAILGAMGFGTLRSAVGKAKE